MRRRAFLKSAAGIVAGLGRIRAASPRAQPKILIVGGGFAGASCALELRRRDPAIEVCVIDPDDRYHTCPMSNSVLAGMRDLDSISVSRRGLERAGVRYVRDRATGVEPQRRRVRLAGGSSISYDRLVVAPGIRFLWGKPEGYDEAASAAMPHAWQAGRQTEILAAKLRSMPDGGVVAISVPAGPMRCPPGPFERATLIAAYLEHAKPRSKVLVFDSNNSFPRQDAFMDAWQSLYPGMIEWIPVTEGGAVVRVEPEGNILHTPHGAHRVDVANVIPPQAPGALAAQFGLASDHGWCPIKPQTFESTLIPRVHVLGDACIADPMPKSASAANAQARHCAAAICAQFGGRGTPAPPLTSVCYSMLARDIALSIHGWYELAGGAIRQVPGPEDAASTRATRSAQEARRAERWYGEIRADAFGA